MPGGSYIAFLDILGFSHLVKNTPAAALRDVYAQILRGSLGTTFYQLYRDEIKLHKLQKPNLQVVSDSIIFWTQSEDLGAFIRLVVFTSIVLRNAIDAGVPLRGSIVHGEIHELALDALVPGLDYFQEDINTKSSVLFGSGLVHAYSLEKMVEWSGCIVDPGCLDFFMASDQRAERIFDSMIGGGMILKKYDVPLKNGGRKRFCVLNWVTALVRELTEDRVRRSFAAHDKPIDHEDVRRKISNTVAFFKACKRSIRAGRGKLA